MASIVCVYVYCCMFDCCWCGGEGFGIGVGLYGLGMCELSSRLHVALSRWWAWSRCPERHSPWASSLSSRSAPLAAAPRTSTFSCELRRRRLTIDRSGARIPDDVRAVLLRALAEPSLRGRPRPLATSKPSRSSPGGGVWRRVHLGLGFVEAWLPEEVDLEGTPTRGDDVVIEDVVVVGARRRSGCPTLIGSAG